MAEECGSEIADKLAELNGKLFEGMRDADKLHLTVKAYQVWADALKPIFTELLGLLPRKTSHHRRRVTLASGGDPFRRVLSLRAEKFSCRQTGQQLLKPSMFLKSIK